MCGQKQCNNSRRSRRRKDQRHIRTGIPAASDTKRPKMRLQRPYIELDETTMDEVLTGLRSAAAWSKMYGAVEEILLAVIADRETEQTVIGCENGRFRAKKTSDVRCRCKRIIWYNIQYSAHDPHGTQGRVILFCYLETAAAPSQAGRRSQARSTPCSAPSAILLPTVDITCNGKRISASRSPAAYILPVNRFC